MTNSRDLFDKIVRVQGGAKAQKSDENSYLIPCPSHKDDKPSLSVTHKNSKVLFKCHAGCSQDNVLDALRSQGLWPEKRDRATNDNSRTKATAKKKFKGYTVIPARTPLPEPIKYGRTEASEVYRYHTKQGKLAFVTARFDYANGSKAVMPYSYQVEEGTEKEGWRFGLRKVNKRPLYNLHELLTRPDQPVLVVEGEKTAEAAKKLYRDHVVTTWSGGTGGVSYSDWLPLRDRDVYIWPDNDEPGLKAASKIADQISKTRTKIAPKLVFDTVQPGLERGWDLADPMPADIDISLDDAEDMDIELVPLDGGTRKEIALRLNKRFASIYLGDYYKFVDLEARKAALMSPIPYYILRNVEQLKIHHPHEFIDISGQSLKPVKEVDAWIDSPERLENNLGGIVYDPSTTDYIVKVEGIPKLNINCGMAVSKASSTEAYKPFVNHIHQAINHTDQAEWLLDWMADIFQNPKKKPGTCVVLVGKPGTGKTVIGNIVCGIIGHRHSYMGAFHTTFGTNNNFNEHMSAKLFVQLDEVEMDMQKRAIQAAIKVATTDATIYINPKGLPAWTETSYHRYLFTTNNRATVEVAMDDRRMAVFDVFEHVRHDREHYDNLWGMLLDDRALGSLRSYLLKRKITHDVSIPPETAAREDMMVQDDNFMSYMEDCLDRAAPPDNWAIYEPSPDWVRSGCSVAKTSIYRAYRRWLRDRSLQPDQRSNAILGRTILSNVFPKEPPRDRLTFTDPDGGDNFQDRVVFCPPRWHSRECYEAMINRNVNWEDNEAELPSGNVVEMEFGDMPE